MSALHPVDEAHDTPPLGLDDCMVWLAYAALILVLLLAYLVGTVAGSWLLHTFDAEIRGALSWAWVQLERLLWAWATLYL